MNQDFEGRFNPEEILAWAKAELSRSVSSGAHGDDTITLAWTIPHGSQQEFKSWVLSNRRVFSDTEIPHQNITEKYRLVSADYQELDQKPSQQNRYRLSAKYAKGYYSELDWSSARLYSNSIATPSNTTTAGVPDSTSDQPRNVLMVRLPFVDPAQSNAVALAAIAAGTVTSTDNAIFSTTYKVISAGIIVEDDLYHSVICVIANPQYVLEAYSDFGGLNQYSVFYLWKVPEALAQGILTAWKNAHPVGSSASCDYGGEGLVNIILRKKDTDKPNLSVSSLDKTCDTMVNYHFAWGYEEGDIADFLNNHNGVPANATYGMAGVTREFSIQVRGDGLFDIIIIETVRTFDASKHIFTLTTFTGNKILQAQTWGWYVPKTNLESYAATYASANKAVNTKSEFVVSRHDDCTFDYRGVIETYEKISTTGTTTGSNGITVSVESARYATQSDLTAAMPASAKRKRHQILLETNDLGSVNYTLVENTVKETANSTANDGGRRLFQAFKNADAVPSTPGSQYRWRGGSISPNDDSSFDGGFMWHDVTPVDNTLSVDNGRKLYYGQWSTALPTPSASEIFQTGGVNIDEDGRLQYSLWFRDYPFHQATAATTGTSGIQVDVESGLYANQTDVNIAMATGAITAPRVRHSISAEPDDNGKIRYNRQSVTVLETADAQATDGVRKRLQSFKNSDSIPTPPAGDLAWASASISYNDDGTADGGILWEDISPLDGTKTYDNKKMYWGRHSTALPTVTANDRLVSGNASWDDNGRISYSLLFKDISTPTSASYTDGTVLFPNAVDLAVDDDPANIPTPTPVDGVTHDVQASIDQDGLASWLHKQTNHTSSGQKTSTISRSDGIVKETTVAERNASAVPTLTSGQQGDIQFKITDANTIDYIKKTLELDPSLPSIITSESAERIVYDADFPNHISSVSARYIDSASGHGWETKISTFLTADAPLTKRRYEYITKTEEYALSPLTASAPAATDGGLGGESKQMVELVSAGLWRKTTISIEYGAWEWVNQFITFVPYAADLVETSSY